LARSYTETVEIVVSEEGPLCGKTVASVPVNTSGFLLSAGIIFTNLQEIDIGE
jgi:hypothetical protein